MPRISDNLPTWLITSAWREILTRIFDHVEAMPNVSPEWLVNPSTNRRLKLDILYPRIGVAVRFEGIQAKSRRQRPSLEEEVQQQTRENARSDVCREHGIELLVVDLNSRRPQNVFRDLDLGLSRAKTQIKDKALIKQINQARATATELGRRIRSLKDLRLYADLWEDRQYRVPELTETVATPVDIPTFAVGMEVEHAKFGPGVILAATPSNGETLLTVDFVMAGQKTLAASLVADKLWPR